MFHMFPVDRCYIIHRWILLSSQIGMFWWVVTSITFSGELFPEGYSPVAAPTSCVRACGGFALLSWSLYVPPV